MPIAILPVDLGTLISVLSGTPLHVLVLIGIVILWRENRSNEQEEINRLNGRVKELEQLLSDCISEHKN